LHGITHRHKPQLLIVMENQRHFIFKPLLIFLFLALVHFQSPALDKAQAFLGHAETYYWLGIQDYGDPGAFNKALQYLQLAEQELKNSSLPANDPESDLIKKQIDALRQDVNEQYKIAHDTYVGRFPLVKFMGQSIFMQSNAHGSYELFEDPGEVAAGNAAEKLGQLFYQHFFGDLQMPVMVFSHQNLHPDMESKIRVILKTSSRIKVYQTQYLNKFLSDDELSALQQLSLTEELIDKVCNRLKVENFALINIHKQDQVDHVHFFSFTTHIYGKGTPAPIQTTTLYELIRDKRQMRWYFIIAFIAFLIFSVLLYTLQYRHYNDELPKPGKLLAGPVMAYLVGFLSTIIAVGLFSNVMPGFHDYYGYTFWWVPAAFIIIIYAPIIAIKAYILKLSFYQEINESTTRLGPLFASSALGAAAYISLGLFLYHGVAGIKHVLIAAIALGTVGFVTGKTFGSLKPLPFRFALAGALFLPLAGAGIAAYSPWMLAIPFFGSAAILIPTRIKGKKMRAEGSMKSFKKSSAKLGLSDLLRLTENPPYRQPGGFNKIYNVLEPFLDGKTVLLCLAGNEGCGKTATAHNLLHKLEKQLDDKNQSHLLLYVQCQETQTTPYYPIQQALIEFINIGGHQSDEAELSEIEDMLDGLLGNFVPFAGLITMGKKEKKPSFNTQSELFISIYKTLTDLARKQSIIFFVDDLQWADKASLDLLRFLHEKFMERHCHQILFLYTSRPGENMDRLLTTHEIKTITPLTYKERMDLLTIDLGIERESAGFILQWTGNQDHGKGGLFWMYKILEQLARNDHLHESVQGLRLNDAILRSQTLPVPEDYIQTIRKEIEQLQDYKKYLAMAACMGLEFEVTILASALGVERLVCLEALQEIENKTSLVIDRPDKDDIFAFTSSFALESLRKELELSHEGPKGSVKQIVREYHARLAAMLEMYKPSGNTLRIARHYYAAGKIYAEKALSFLIPAASKCTDLFRFDEAQKFLDMAREEFAFIEESQRFDLDILLVECRISALEGTGYAEVAKKCNHYLDKNPEISVRCLLVFAQVQYYAQDFKRTGELCKMAIEKTDDPLVLAEAYHLLGLSIDFKQKAAERMEILQKAMDYVTSVEEQSADVLRTLSAIHNSLGEEYSKNAYDDISLKEKARNHFQSSIELKLRKDINDKPGLARSYGGLGRLEMTIPPQNIEKALEYFREDLRMAQETGDKMGSIIMYSSIGNCYLLLNDNEKARTAYEKSLALSERPSDKVFALVGLLKVYDKSPDEQWGAEAADQLAQLLDMQDFKPQHFLEKDMRQFFQQATKKEFFNHLIEKLV
jgi:tetratricopeptide (TPR) repeat protein